VPICLKLGKNRPTSRSRERAPTRAIVPPRAVDLIRVEHQRNRGFVQRESMGAENRRPVESDLRPLTAAQVGPPAPNVDFKKPG